MKIHSFGNAPLVDVPNPKMLANNVMILAACSLLRISKGLYSAMVLKLVSPLSFIRLIASRSSGSLFMLKESANVQKLSRIQLLIDCPVVQISANLLSIISFMVSFVTIFLNL